MQKTKEEKIVNTYNVPRNVKGEGRILFIFSTKALIYTAVGIGIGLFFYLIFSIIKLKIAGIICIIVLGLIGFIVGTCKIPDTNSFEFTKKTGGENIDDVIKRAFLFKNRKGRLYVYKQVVKEEEETEDDK